MKIGVYYLIEDWTISRKEQKLLLNLAQNLNMKCFEEKL